MAGNGYQSGWGGAPSGGEQYGGDQYGGPYQGDQPGFTREFPAGGADGYPEPAHDLGYEQAESVATYRAGARTAPRASGPRPRWRELLTGLYRSPNRTFDLTRDHQLWLPAVTVSLLYGVLAVLGFGDTHNEVVSSTFTVAAWSLAGAAIGFTLAGLMLGSVTYALARQLGGDGPLASTVGLAVLIGWTTDVPRLLLALFLPSGNPVVQALGWASWLLCAGLLTAMVRRVHDLPWGKAAGAASLQLLALLVLIKLPTLG
ncbi:Yip1 family protein [Kitasatospora azatica]|uniref:Yip1 family protein n=1 Tax=Kitasatospora azatica TaxID=58347 RepID=UPI00068BF8FF|nr:Yip1 family protein [Kitasatospora azatica]